MLPEMPTLIVAAVTTVATVAQDTGAVAYVPKAGGPPDSSSYMWIGYAITFAADGGYSVLLLRRMARARRS